jgi:uncharacterized protein YoxC
MIYDNLSRQELIQLIKKRNKEFDDLNKKVNKIQKEVDMYKISETKKLLQDLKNQKRVFTELISSLRICKAEYMQLNKTFTQLNELYKKKIK